MECIIRVMSKHGDDRHNWKSPEEIATNDVEARAAVKEAERIFNAERARGATAYKVVPGQPTERLDQFDPSAQQIVMVPRVVGG